jgi:uncharacterized protein (DUF2252 family)
VPVAERIQQFNSNRITAYTTIKYGVMAINPFCFFRGTAHLFYEDLSKEAVIPASPLTWVCGDLHLENFGSYKGDNRLVYFDLNDFDEGALAPAAWELTRMVSSIFIALATMDAEQKEMITMGELFLKTYATILAKGRARYIEPQTASGIVKTFLEKVCERRQKELIRERAIKKDGRLKLHIDQKRLFKIDKQLKPALCDYINQWLTEHANHHKRYRVIDAGFRIAGTGSIGINRYIFLVEKKDSNGKLLLIDMKQSLRAVLQSWLPNQQPAWTSEAERVVAIQERMQNISPALLGTANFNNDSYVIKEMQPTADKIDFTTLANRRTDIEQVIENMALLTASAQLRSSGRQGAANADELIAFGNDPHWIKPIIDYAHKYARQVKEDYREYVKAYKSGYFS